ncbi:MAG TPA: hypothetical protein VD839_06835 [Burkholderiales bacterium]|nr:hypothetical protein [Burkholderiales bacterium]
MYKKCPKCAHERAPGETGPEDICAACGLIFSKYLKSRLAPAAPLAATPADDDAGEGWLARLKEAALYVPDEVDALYVYARAALLAALIVYGIRLAAMDVPSWEMAGSLIHAPMVPFHEFGHIFFRPFGEFMTHLGGALFQAGLPLVLGGIFLVKNRDPFAAAVMLWWSAAAVMDTAPYVYDAQVPQHILLTGRTGDTGAHDFIDVLGDLGLLGRAQAVGRLTHGFGVVMLIASFVWATAIVWRQYRVRT